MTARLSNGQVQVTGSIPITFADYGIDNPSFGPASVGDDGTLEFLLVFEALTVRCLSRLMTRRLHQRSEESADRGGAGREVGVLVAQLAFEHLARHVAGQRLVADDEVAGQLEVGQLTPAGRQHVFTAERPARPV